MHGNVCRVALFSAGFFLVAAPLRPDALVITQAMKETTIAEMFMRCFRANPSFGSSKRRTEIEKPSKRVLLKNGGPAAGFTHALSQVNDWLDVFKEHRGACLDAMKVPRKMVTRVRGLFEFDPEHVPENFLPYTVEEISALRR